MLGVSLSFARHRYTTFATTLRYTYKLIRLRISFFRIPTSLGGPSYCAVGVEFSPFFQNKKPRTVFFVMQTTAWQDGGCGEHPNPPFRAGRRDGMAEGNKIYQIALEFCLHGILSLNWAQFSPFYYIDYGKDNWATVFFVPALVQRSTACFLCD